MIEKKRLADWAKRFFLTANKAAAELAAARVVDVHLKNTIKTNK